MWYVIQVTTGKEEAIKAAIEELSDCSLYQECFLIKRERIWRRDGECIFHIETMFPGYLFLIADDPTVIYQELKKIPQFTKVLKLEEEQFLAVAEDEQEFLENLIDGDPDYIVRLSKVAVNEEKEIVAAEGPLKYYVEHIVKKKLRLRYVMVETVLFGRKREVLIGVKTEEDE